ncbi:manganese efflux pump MntP family protein [Gracilinema caldarium]|uniref:manganese efflux pump MntP n=1 Tax=Gracilinema caldarium TaxID=215591 RepID=UPI0026F0BE67|nr:manganese efflux pump MntP family protein [Gracilinema caldarium]
MFQTLLIAIGLSMDAFAVSVSSGICTDQLKARHILRGSFSFGLFQFAMPVLGWFLGTYFRVYIQKIDHWIAFVLLAFIGIKMVIESFENENPACEDGETPQKKGKTDVRDVKILLTLSIATSIDALAVGLSYSLLGKAILFPALTIGAVTFGVCLAGFEFGKRIGYLIEKRAELAGGIILIAIGLKILLEHLL